MSFLRLGRGKLCNAKQQSLVSTKRRSKVGLKAQNIGFFLAQKEKLASLAEVWKAAMVRFFALLDYVRALFRLSPWT
jgi:hypothetical protein